MNRYSYDNIWSYTFDQEHGFGIRFTDFPEKGIASGVFYEDEVLDTGEDPDPDNILGRAISEMLDWEDTNWIRYTSEEERELDRYLEHGSCTFLPLEDGIQVVLKEGRSRKTLESKKAVNRYNSFFKDSCTCGKSRCVHMKAVGMLCWERLDKLQHKYILSSQPVPKNLFLVYDLELQIDDGILRTFEVENIDRIRSLIRKVDAAKSPDYYQRFHDVLLNVNSDWEYDAHFLDRYIYLLLALFEDRGYYEAIIESGYYTNSKTYESRQQRSNRTCFKRNLKEYEKLIREMDAKEGVFEDVYKEFLLIYRRDDAALLKYLALEKEELEEDELCHLDRISKDSEADPQYCLSVARKLDALAGFKKAASIFQRLLEHISHEDVIRLYSEVEHFSMPMETVRTLPLEEQRQLINNLPVTKDNVSYVMDTLLSEEEPSLRGRYLLKVISQTNGSTDDELKKLILKKAAELPDNRLLLSYLIFRMNSDRKRGNPKPKEGDPRKELSTYFDCNYRIENEQSSYTVCYIVADPVSPLVELIGVYEQGEDYSRLRTNSFCPKYSAELVKSVCLEGKEEAFARDLEKNRDAVDAYLFETNNRKFVTAYRRLCQSFQEEKIVFRAASKAEIEWLLYRNEGSNALAFKIGNTKKYIVKDAVAFLAAFREGQTLTYGKDLIMTHDPDNLNERDAAVIKLLMAAKYTRGRKGDNKNKRYITVSDSVLVNLIELLTGSTVLYNDEPCLIRLAMQKLRLKIDGRYILSTSLEKGQEFMNLLGKGYVLSREGAASLLYLDRVEGSAEEIGLIELVDSNPSVSVKPILKDFRKNIYARYFELFDVEKALAPDFRLSEIRFSTYFDYEKSVITSKVKMTKDDQPISPEHLSERMDLAKYELLSGYLSELGFENGIMEDESRILSFFKMDFTRLKSLTNVYLSDTLQNKELKTIGKPVVRVTYNNDIMQAFLEKSEYTEEELEKILSGIRKKKKFILLSGNRIVDLDSEAARDFADTVKDLDLNPKDLYEKKQISMVTAIKAFAHEKSCRTDKYLRDMIEEIRSFKEAEIQLPELLTELRDYQVEGFNWLSILTKYGMGGILADDMGLGKTIQIISLIKADPCEKPSLVVCPKSLIFNWVSEFARFDGTTEVEVIYGPDAIRGEKLASLDYGKKAVYITSYDSLRNDIARYTGEFNYGILDEAQYIKNVHALKTKSVKELKTLHRFALTGTPIENSVVDLWSIFDYILPGYFEELSRFRESDNTAIAKKAAPFILRRVKEDVLEDLPPKYERILTAEMGGAQRKVYDGLRMEARRALESGGKAFDILPYLTRLRQICVDPGMFLENYAGGSGKLEMLKELIPEYLKENHRILVFSQFVKALESVNRMLQELGIPAYFLSGATAAKDRIEMMDSFNNGSGTDVFLVSLKAGGTGLNLTGADTVIHLDPWWNVAAENQASDRTHRIGQKRNVEVIKVIAENTIEQRVVELQDIKKEVIKQVISDDDGSVTSASLEDIAFVLD